MVILGFKTKETPKFNVPIGQEANHGVNFL